MHTIKPATIYTKMPSNLGNNYLGASCCNLGDVDKNFCLDNLLTCKN